MKYIFCSAEFRRGIAESRRGKAIKKLGGSQRILGGSLRNKKIQKTGGMGRR